ncbi:SDR family NAD(P)-dependent oxidoreductase [Asticcacaulis sp. BYS171W]|uniref:SDR family NAD(P)-dependent oxidoreductase n=1 Tax=Asticcacaulis aquaticus TaxID=2984212 RepID=A0ABT5HZV8_9CAUL|nr:SDR family NAD(P)-dependent oxidoreductase [Asticcacaulis aquaticus]MDC7684966.1 SDR family NAD(P)-dependent oxidoreductase [Asticcacaulis aquaticus]
MLLKDKVLLVTGGSKGIGRGIAVAAARHGAKIGINFAGDEASAQSAVEEIKAAGGQAFALRGDVSKPESATAFVAAAVEAYGRLDVFVNNAGICPFHGFLDMPVETVDRTIAVNLNGAYYMCQAAANQMVKQGKGANGFAGSIVAVSSISALVGGEYQTHYTPTKAGVLSLMQSTAIALGKHGIRCNAVLPGTILTDINKDDLADLKKREYMEARIPLGRLGQPEDLAGPVIFLASDELAGYVTGASLLVDGGMFVNLQ